MQATLRLPREGFTLDVALALPERGVSALFGPSGCGKTTVLRALAGLERADGRVTLGDEVWQDDARGHFVPTHRRAIGYVIQEAALFPHLSVRGNLDYGRRRSAGSGGQRAATQAPLAPLIELLGIGHLLDRRPETLSGGERQRVAIARALATGPRLLLMDEPLAALDAARKAEVLPYLDRLHAELAIPIVYVSHAIEEVARLAHHLVLMDEGRIVAAGTLADVMARLDLPTARGDSAGVVLDGVVVERDSAWQLARLQVGARQGGDAGPGGQSGGLDEGARSGNIASAGTSAGTGDFSVWARDHGLPVGRAVRVRLLARDVSLARAPLTGTSIGNQLRGTVEAIADDEHPALALVRVRVGGSPVVARLTRRSAHALELAPGLPVWAQVKTVALME
ncbi:MAG: molybdenum ABC transporter ATP-binding protein [Rubrivivax sp.]|nr:molybdenum ABC transporter ATP-binding protein [Rubrivivax sp.]